MKEKEIKEELRIYSERCYAKPLQEAGFVSYRNDYLNWYKIYNGIICHFHLLVVHSRLPMLMQVWWFDPTFIPSILKLPAAYTNYQEINKLFEHRVLFSSHTVEPGCGIGIPRLPQLGAERLYEELFPQIEQLQTRKSVYESKRERIFSWLENPVFEVCNATTPDFADEALMIGDTDMFPDCIKHIEALIPLASIPYPHESVFKRSPELLQAQLNALKGIEVEQYVGRLKERKRFFLKRYKLQDDVEL